MNTSKILFCGSFFFLCVALPFFCNRLPTPERDLYAILCHGKNGADSLTNSTELWEGDSITITLKTSALAKQVYVELIVLSAIKDTAYKFIHLFKDDGTLFNLGSIKFPSTGAYSFNIKADSEKKPIAINNAIVTVMGRKPQIMSESKKINTTGKPIIGSSFIFSLYAIGSQPLTYQWFKNQTLIENATKEQYKIEKVSNENSGDYLCIVSNKYGKDTSSVYKLIPENSDKPLPPIIADNKAIKASVLNPTVDSPLTLSITATGKEPIKYQWLKNNSPMNGEINSRLYFQKVTKNDEGAYRCIASNEYGSDTSVSYTLLFSSNNAPSILNGKQIICSGKQVIDSSLSLMITATGNEPLSYEWHKNLEILSSNTKNVLKISKLKKEDEGIYFCIVSNTFGSDTSKPFIVSFANTPPQWFQDTVTVIIGTDSLFILKLPSLCQDIDNDSLQYKLLNQKPEGDSISSKHEYIWRPLKADTGSYHVRITLSDSKAEDTLLLAMKVKLTNNKPKFLTDKPMDSYKINPSEVLSINVSATDDENSPLFLVIDKKSTLARLDSLTITETATKKNYQLVWKSNMQDAGKLYTLLVGITDNIDTTYKKIDIAVGNVNLPPKVTLSKDNIVYNDSTTLSIKENDALLFIVKATDPENSPLRRVPGLNLPPKATYDTLEGLFKYTPEFNVSTSQTNTQFRSIKFEFKEKIENGQSGYFTLNIIVLNVNRPPVIDQSKLEMKINIVESKSKTFSPACTDPDDDRIYFRFPPTSMNRLGSISAQSTSFTYTAYNLKGSLNDSYEFQYSDSPNLINPNKALLKIQIIGLDQKPSIASNKTTISISKTNPSQNEQILLEATDVLNDTLQWKVDENDLPKVGSIKNDKGGSNSGNFSFKTQTSRYHSTLFYIPPSTIDQDSDSFSIYSLDAANNRSAPLKITVTFTSK